MVRKLAVSTVTMALTVQTAHAAVSVHDVSFENGGEEIVGRLYLPEKNVDRLPGVIVTGAWMTVQEQMPKTYAVAMASRGFAALTFDFRGWGKSKRSDGNRNFIEDPTEKISDIKAAAKFLSTRPEVDPDRISGVGICASAGYMAQAASESTHISAISLVAPWLHDSEIVEKAYGGKQAVSDLELQSDVSKIVPAASATDRSAVMFDVPYYTETARGLIPEWDNKFNTCSWRPWLRFDAQSIAPNLRVPVLIIHSSDAAIPEGARLFYSRLKEPKEQVWLEKVSQFDFYDRPRIVDLVSVVTTDFFRRNEKPCEDAMNLISESSNALNIALIENLIESVANLADNRNFESLESCFANEVHVDYTSAFGGEPEVKQKQALMSAWAALLPGFDVTRHQLSNISVKLLDDTHSTATADVIADHHIGGEQWQVKGTYDYAIDKVDSERWVVRGMTFNLTGEAGSRDLLSRASSAASTKPVSYLQRLQTMQVVREFLKSLEEKNMEKFASLWADDAVQEMPYSPQNFPKRVEGKTNLVAHYSAWPENSGEANFSRELVFFPTLDPQVVFVEYHGVCEIKTTGRIYDQRYGGLFRVVDGKIKLFREYFDPNVFSRAFSLDEGGSFKK